MGFLYGCVTSCLVSAFTFEHQAVMSKELSNLTLLIPLIESGTKTELLMFKAGIIK